MKMLSRIGALMAAAMLILSGTAAFAADLRVQRMGQQFLAALPGDWHAVLGDWRYLDIEACYTQGSSCFGNNPSSPYGFPAFPETVAPAMDFRLEPTEAVVIFLKTPPQVRYFGFTQYLQTRNGGTHLFASLSDTLNHLRFVTLKSTAPGTEVFNQYAVVAWTADMNTLAKVQQTLAAQGIPASAINFVPLPIQLPLFMGYAPTADTFTMLMRTALAQDPSKLQTYLADKPFFVVKTGPNNPTPVVTAPTIGYASEASGVAEDGALGAALDSLIADIRNRYVKSYSLSTPPVLFKSTVGWDCIAGNSSCDADNHDALYGADVSRAVIVSNLSDLVIIAGVNHRKTGKALYINHAVYDTLKKTGITAVDDTLLTSQSAYYHAGVFLPGDPRRSQYANLYAYAISYDCSGVSYCLQIPAPTPENPIGLAPGSPFYLVSRDYVDPHTDVRPSINEIIAQRIVIATKR